MARCAVVIDRDKKSQHAVRWALENLMLKEKVIILVHVAQQKLLPQDCEAEMHQLFLPHRVLCARKGVRTKEVVLHDHDIATALSDFIGTKSIKNIVIGASNRCVITRAFKNADIPTCVAKLAPDFCCVYAVSKGKSHKIKSALPPHIDTRQGNSVSSSPTEMSIASSAPSTSSSSNDSKRPIADDVSFENRPPAAVESWRKNCSLWVEADESEQQNSYYASSDISYDDADTLATELEDELKRVKLELKQITDKYNAACLESLAARQKALLWSVNLMNPLPQYRSSDGLKLAKHNQELQGKRIAKRRRTELRKQAANKFKIESGAPLARCKRYSMDEIEAATKNFTSNKIGEGSYGPVYRATIDHTPVAIKVLQSDLSEGLKQFHQEVEVLSRMRHPNMVLLLGACPDYGCLVYEYMDNGCLEDRLFCRGDTPPLPWTARFRIATEIATGLNFLHQTRPQPVVHRDLKPANILLDSNLVGKIGDVGLSRLVPAPVPDKATQYRKTAAAGTFCYIDPEYQQTGLLGTKSDVYSLGIILLQIITAKPPMGLRHQVNTAVEAGRLEEILDQRVEDWPLEETLALAKLGLKCSEMMRRDRPDLGSVVLPELERLRGAAESFLRNQKKSYYFTYSHNQEN